MSRACVLCRLADGIRISICVSDARIQDSKLKADPNTRDQSLPDYHQKKRMEIYSQELRFEVLSLPKTD